jgi:two-component system LytT family response regulator
MKKYQAIIADDEALVRERISNLLKSYNEIEVSAQCADGLSTITAFQLGKPNLLFLDIQMPKASGFHVLEQINTKDVLIIFVTAYDQYAIKAFEFAAFDYLLKPITEKRFQKTMSRALDVLESHKEPVATSIYFKSDGIVRHIQINEITHLEAADNHVLIHTQNNTFKKRTTLQKMVAELMPHGFIQVHRSFVVHPQHIQEMVRVYRGDYLVRLSSGKVITTSKSFRENVKSLYA